MNAADHVKAIREARALDERVARERVEAARTEPHSWHNPREYCGWLTIPRR